MKYESIEHVTSNENGDEQLTLFHNVGIFRKLLKKPQRVETYVERGVDWLDKNTLRSVGLSKWAELEDIRKMIKYVTNEND